MSDTKYCSECQSPLPEYWPKGLCAQCALDGALGLTNAESRVLQAETPAITPADPKPPGCGPESSPVGSFGDYELLDEIARGGMGVVYKARQKKLGRIVAVKLILAGPLAGKDFVRRFRTESAAAAILQHSNIVAIHDVGVHEGRHYFSMDYVEGQNLAQLVGQQPLPPARAARYVELIAAAIHYAHERGILHRDLKPSNVLIDANDQPRITDFGLAKRLDGESSLTLSGHVLGSPNFMPPEQAGAKRGKVGRPSDVYALGGILYYLLTARAPFQAESLEGIVTQVLNVEPVAPRLLNPATPKDLETITLKCLEKESSRRYRTAQELADELNRFLRHEPIKARPIMPPEKFWRWCRRKPAFASALGFAFAALLAGFATTTWQWRRAEQQLYVANMGYAQAAWEQNNVSRVRQLLEETATAPERGFEWYYWQRQMHRELVTLRGHIGPILAVAYSPDGQRIVTGSADNTAKVWDAASGKELISLIGHSDSIRSVAFSSNGQRIVTGSWDRTAKVWDAAKGAILLTLAGHRAQILCVAISPDSERIVTGSFDQSAKLWDAATGKNLRTFNGHTNPVWAVAFSPDGQRIVSGSWDQTAKVWDVVSGKELCTLIGHRDAIFSVAFSPNCRSIVTGGQDQVAKVWDAASGAVLRTLKGHSAPVFSVGFSLDGQRILTGGDDQTARVWDAASGEELRILKGHGSRIGSAAFSPDGQRIVTGGGAMRVSPDGQAFDTGTGDDQSAKVWDAADGKEVLTLEGHTNAVSSVAFSPDGRLLVSGSFDGTARMWNVGTGQELFSLTNHSAAIRSVAFFPDGQRIVTGSFDGTARIWEIASRKELYRLECRSPIFSVAVSLDGQWIATGSSEDTTVTVWHAATGQHSLPFRGLRGGVFSVVFSPDSRRIGGASGDGIVKVWEAASGKELLTFREKEKVWSATFSADGRRLVTGSLGLTATVRDAASGKAQLTLKGHTLHIFSAAFSPDGHRIVTGSADQTAKLWDAATGKELLTFKGHRGSIFSVAFSPDGQRIVTASRDHSIKVWEAASKEQVAGWQKEEQGHADDLAAKQRERAAAAAAAVESARALRANMPGAIKQWLILSPIAFDGRDGARALREQQVAQESQLRPRAGERTKAGQSELVWRGVQSEDYLIDFNRLVGAPTEWSVAYAVCYIQSEAAKSGVLLKIGSDDQAKVYLNGTLIYESTSPRKYPADEDPVAGVALEAGLNVLVFKVVNETQDWKGSVRLTDAAGQPVKGTRVVLTPP